MALRCSRKRRLRSSELPFRPRLPALGFLLLLYSKLATKATISLKCAVLPARRFILSHRPTVCFSNITGNPATLKFQIGLCVHASIGGVFFYPRDAMLALYELQPCISVSVRVCVTSRTRNG